LRAHEFAIEAPTDVSRRGFLKGLASIAASTAIPQNTVAKILKAVPKSQIEILGDLFKNINPHVLNDIGHEYGMVGGNGEHAISAFTNSEYHALHRLVRPLYKQQGFATEKDAVYALQKLATMSSKTSNEYYKIFEHLLGKPLEVRKLENILASHGTNAESFFGQMMSNEPFEEAFMQLSNDALNNMRGASFEPIANLKPLPQNWAAALGQSVKRFANNAGQVSRFTGKNYLDKKLPDLSPQQLDQRNANQDRVDKEKKEPEKPKEFEKPKDDKKKITSYGGSATGKFVKPLTAKISN
jgi:hypothetical protein